MKFTQYLTAVATVGFGLICSTSSPAHGHSRQPIYGAGVVSGRLVNGGTYLLTPAFAVPLTAVELWYAAPSIGFGDKPTGSIARLAAQAVAASKPPSGVSLGEYVESIGGTLSIDVFPDSVAITALVPAIHAQQAVHVMTESYFAPVVTDAGLRRAKLDLATQAILAKYDPDTVMRNGLLAEMFTAGPEHYPVLDIRDLNALDIDTVKAFASKAFQTRRASLVIGGSPSKDVLDDAVVGGAIGAQDDWDSKNLVSTLAKKPATVTLPFNIPGSGFAWTGPGIEDEVGATAMDFIADYLFNPNDGKVTRRLATDTPGVTLNGQFITLRNPGIFIVSLSGEGSDAAAKIVRDEMSALMKPMSAANFERARNAFIYHLQSNLQTPADLAASLGWYATEGRPGYAPGAFGSDGAYFHDAAALSPKKIAETASEFFTREPSTVTLQPAAQEKTH